jgi:hypothetical protein
MANAACAKAIIDGAAATGGLMACLGGTANLLRAEGLDVTTAEDEQFRSAKAAFENVVNGLLTTWTQRLGITSTINPDIDI